MTVRRAIAAVAVAMSAAASSVSAGQAAAGAAGAAPLTLSAACEGQGPAATLRVRITNPGDRDTAIVLGRLVGAERTQVIDSLFVMATRLATGAAEDFAFVNPKHVMLTGRSEPWIVTVPAGGVYDLDAPVGFFVSRLNYSFLEPLGLPGTRLLLDARPLQHASPPRGVAVWSGQVETPIQPCR